MIHKYFNFSLIDFYGKEKNFSALYTKLPELFILSLVSDQVPSESVVPSKAQAAPDTLFLLPQTGKARAN